MDGQAAELKAKEEEAKAAEEQRKKEILLGNLEADAAGSGGQLVALEPVKGKVRQSLLDPYWPVAPRELLPRNA